MIRVDALWLSVAPLYMRAGTDTILAQGAVVQVFGKRSATPSTLGSRNSVFVSTPNGVDTYPLQFLLNSASAYACPAVGQ